MLLEQIQRRIKKDFRERVKELFAVEVAEPAMSVPPSLELGDLSITACFELAKTLRQPPRKIAEQIAACRFEGVERVSVAGGGYLNFHLDRAGFAVSLFDSRSSRDAAPRPTPQAGKIVVEHTSINPNKAAHIGHLRNAVLGDTFARLLRFRGHCVEVQNYIDNTGVQVADVVVGFRNLEGRSVEEVRQLAASEGKRFDYYCWDLYAKVFEWYEREPAALEYRTKALHAIEEGRGEIAEIGAVVSDAIVRLHLRTMRRINVAYDLLVRESEILQLKFWSIAFELMKQRGAIRLESAGKNRGCWVMDLDPETTEPKEDTGEDTKVIVRSSGTVTYVGKDIAYHLWKFGLLGRDFHYRRLDISLNGSPVWQTATEGDPDAPPFGRATAAYAVIDTRQSYVQHVVATAFRALGYHEQAANLHHFAYELVSLSLDCARELGLPVGEEEQQKGAVDVSGRRGWGVKADDFIDTLTAQAIAEVHRRQMAEGPEQEQEYGRQIAVGALRYFLLRFTRRTMIVFDFKDALAFEGETGPYLQYTVVRAQNILRKYAEVHPEFHASELKTLVAEHQLKSFLAEGAFWELVFLAGQLELTVDQAIAAEEPAMLAKYAFRLAQEFNNFYHRHRVLTEPDEVRRSCLLYVVYLVAETLRRALDLMGIEVPERM